MEGRREGGKAKEGRKKKRARRKDGRNVGYE